MQINKDEKTIHYWINKTGFDQLFSCDLLPYLEIHSFLKKESLYKEGGEAFYLYYLVSGRAKVYMTHLSGQRSLLHIAEAPTFIGEMELLEIDVVSKGVEAIEHCVCLALPREACKQHLMNDVVFLKSMSQILAQKARHRAEIVAKSYAHPFENRFAAFILSTEHGGVYNEPHTEASEYLSVSYRHLLYTLQHFQLEGYLEKSGREYLIKNREALDALACVVL